MTEEQRRYAVGTLKSGGASWDGSPGGYRNGSGSKGVRFQDFQKLYTLVFPEESASDAANELLKNGEIIAVTFRWQKPPMVHGRVGKARLRDISPLSAITEEGNPMLYLVDRVPAPVRAGLDRLRKHAEKVSRLLAETRSPV